jgi:type II secretory ATPase GspE/PulE/Tfp pilus assembly ATPase PilB-like protein
MGEKIVMRILDSSRVMTGLAELGLEGKQLESLQRLIARPHGMTLVTGPTGSGKTSTLYACLCSINTENVNIVTIEDPVEYQLEGITQVQVDTNIDLGFADGLRSTLRQDPDVIMVGEVRDADTAHVAVRAALTGHLVFSTLHANTAVGAISALVNMGIPPYLVAAALAGVVSQRLVRRICDECKKPFAPPKGILAELGLGERTRKKFYMGDGCGHCLNTGYRGRTGLFEVVEVTEELRRAVVERQGEHTLREIAHKRSVALIDAGKEKIFEGVTTPSEVLKAVTIQ